ncbi:MAG: SpoIIE family protein phosphatase [Spirochaetota bacterium]
MARAKIMVVEDEGLVAEEIKEDLENLGYTVPTVAFSGDDAVKKVLENEIDLVLMDIRLKGQMDGIDAAEQIRNMLDIPIIYLTAYSDDATLNRAKITDAFGYILKPVEERYLYAAVEMALNKSRQERKLKGSKEWLSAIIRCMAEGVMVVDLKGRVRYINPAASVLTKWRQDEVFNRRLDDIFKILDEKSRMPVRVPVTQPILEGKVVRRENFLLITKEGKERPVDATIAPFRNERGNTVGLILVFQDRTERKKVQEQVQRELDATSQMQRSLLPKKNVSIAGIKNNWLFYPSNFGAGDIFNFFSFDKHHLGFYLLDVKGHGFTAALLSMTLHRFLSPDAEQGGILTRPLSEETSFEIISPAEVIKSLNKRFYFENNDNPFFTIVYGIIETNTGNLKLVRAGHTYPIFQKENDDTYQIKTEGYAVGIFKNISLEEYECTIEKGARLFIYSDGLTECANETKERFSTERLINFLKENAETPMDELIKGLEKEIVRWRGGNQFDDDISVLTLERE